jgi:carbamoyl-phosphate synthase large subunit
LGVGGNVSQGILKALELGSLSCRVIGACISPLSLGLYTTDAAYVSPRADDTSFLPWVVDLCEREAVDAILSGAEPVLTALSAHAPEIRDQTGAVCVVSPPEVLEVGQDKLLTCRWLEANGLPHPRFADAEDGRAVAELVAEKGFPLVAKPRRGKGAEGVALIGSDEELAPLSGRTGFVIQEHLGGPDEEYTAGCLCDSGGGLLGTMILRRALREGTTVFAEAGEFPEVRAEVERIVSALGPKGPCNVQLRIAEGRAIPFELNVRFSGTTPVRVRLGFNEVETALRHLVLGEPATRLRLITAGRVIRYWNEMYVSNSAVDALASDGHLANPRHHPLTVEDWGFDR